MKKRNIYFALFISCLFAFACKKVVVHSTETNAILPLAIGNTWTYTDTLILSTTVPTLDTVISEITYTVEKQIFLDAFSDGEIYRLYGWQIISDEPTSGPTIVIPYEGVIYGSGDFMDRIVGNQCQGTPTWDFYRFDTINGLVIQRHSSTPSTSLIQGQGISVVYPASPGDTIYSYPIFQDFQCLPFPLDGFRPYYPQIELLPMVFNDSLASVQTTAGTFNCLDFGSQFWAPNIGLVKSIHTGQYPFTDINNSSQTYNIVWTRTLKEFHF